MYLIADDANLNIDPTSVFSIGVARNNRENRFHANNKCFSFFPSLIIGTMTSKGNGGYKFIFSNDK